MSNNILIYYASNASSNVIETIATEFSLKADRVYLLTQAKEGELHAKLKNSKVVVGSTHIVKKNAILFYLQHLLYLIKFCRVNKITAVQSHLQQANIISVFAQYFIKAKVVVYRHHLVEPSKRSAFFDTVINRLASLIVVPSSVIKNKMISSERVQPRKIKLIPYVYDFNNYASFSGERVKLLKQQYPAKLLVLLCGRFVPLKRNELAIYAVEKLVNEGLDIKLIALDTGPGINTCKEYVQKKQLDKFIFFAGFQKTVVDYLAACDVLVHPSFTEASNNTVKEAAMFEKNVIVCKDVGDFSDYIVHRKNGYLVDRDNPLEEIILYLNEIYHNENRASIGENLKKNCLPEISEIIHNHTEPF